MFRCKIASTEIVPNSLFEIGIKLVVGRSHDLF